MTSRENVNHYAGVYELKMSEIDGVFHQIQRIALYLFFFSINFEVWDPLNTGGYFSLSKLTGLIYFATIIPRLKTFTSIGTISYFMLPVWLFFLLLTVVSCFNINSMSSNFFHFSIFQNIILFLILVLHAREEPSVLEKGMLCFAFGSICLTLLYMAGIGIEYTAGRVSLFGDNENAIGLRMCISMTILLLAIFQNSLNLGKIRYLFIVPVPLMLHVLFQTGSRVATLAFGMAFIMSVLLFKTKKIWHKISVLVGGGIALFSGWLYMLQSESLIQRFLRTAEEGDLAGRDVIWQQLISLIMSDPIFGVGITGYTNFTHTVFGRYVSPHNVLIEILCYTGFVGLIIYLLFLFRIFKSGYQSYRANGLILPMVLWFPILGMLLSGQMLYTKIGWISLAYIASSSMLKESKI
jgi:O-antigen ligase